MKKTFEAIGLISLACFSFFYTNKITTVIKENDDILKQIEEISSQNKIDSIDALIDNNTIIPGLKGMEIDINKSYKAMKKINQFNYNLLVYKDIYPSISIENNYDKYIISGNKNKREVSLIFLIDSNDSISSLISILNKYKIKATLFTDGIWFENNNEQVLELINNNHIVGNLGYNFNYNTSGISWMNSIVTKIANQKHSYCYVINNTEYLKICSFNKSYTITPSIIATNNFLYKVKESITSGSIISLDLNDNLIKELPLIIEYINSRDLKMVTIEELIKE